MTNPKNATPPTTAPATPAQPSVAEQIWSEIKDKEILMFALPGQKVSDFCQPVFIEPSRCFLLYKASSALPSVEAAIGPTYECSAVEKYIVITRKPKNVF